MKISQFFRGIILLAFVFLVGCVQDASQADCVGIFNVKDFGAKGDGKTSDTLAIQSAIDAASKVQGTVYFPDGKYMCANLKTYPNIKLKGEQKWGYSTSYGANLILNDYSAKCLLDISDSKNIRITGLMFNASRNPKSKTHGIMFDRQKRNHDTDTVTIEYCKIRGFGGHGVYLNNTFVLIMRGCMINKNLGSGVECKGCDFYVIDNVFGGNGKYGFGGRLSSGMFTHNRVEWNESYGFYFGNGGNYLNITGNQFDHNHGAGVRLENVWSSTISGNGFRRNGRNSAKLFEGTDSANLIIQGNGISATGNTFIAGHTDGKKDYWTPKYAVMLSKSQHCIVSSNTMFHGYTVAPFIEKGENKNCVRENNTGAVHPQNY